MGEGMLFLGQLDANMVALDVKTGNEVWKTPIEDWRNGYGITNAPLYYDGIVYTGNTGGEFGVRSRLTALDAKTGRILWRWYALPGPGEFGSDTWPAGTDHAMRGGASIWNTPALDPQLGLIYFVTGNCGPDYDGSMREGDNLFCASIIALNAKTGAYAWHFQQVHHDIWDYDAASPVVLFDTVINGQPRKGIAEAGRTGWVYILDRTNGKPLIGIEERPVPQEPKQKTAKTQPYPIGDATVPQCAQPMEGYEKAGCIFEPFWEEPVLIQPSGQGGTNWSPMPYSPDTGYFYVPGTIRTSVFSRVPSQYTTGLRYTNGTQAPPIGAAERYLHGNKQHDQQDRVARPDALSHGRRGWFDRDGRGPSVAWRARRQLRRSRRQDWRGLVEVSDWLWCRRARNGLRGRRRPVHCAYHRR
jgi:quinohemoprotein ethanol dehydrogenase